MKNPPASHSVLESRQGSALLILLSFVVLVTVMILAFFSRTMSERKVSNSSASKTQVDLFTQGAMETIVGDLKQEIVDGSTAQSISTGNVTTTIYRPQAPATAVPALAGSTGANGLENLVKRSASGVPFYSGGNYTGSGVARASAASTTSSSKNGRSIGLDRWNKPLLLPATSGSDLTPKLTSGNFTAPDWILVNRAGANPTTWSDSLKWSASSSSTVIGRFAYAIYDEGGLLDMNVAGYPSSAASGTANQAELALKGALAFADLTQLPTLSGNLSQADVDKIISWRNAGTAATGAGYINAARSNTTGFLTVNSINDRAFLSRQQLIQFLTNGPLSLSKADGQSLLQYMGTFSRDLNQPSFAPDPNRPKIVSGTTGNYGGGNNQYQLDDLVNPVFPALRVGIAFDRHDGSRALPGEPLVKKRFALNRLAWLTCKGPSASRSSSTDPDIEALKASGLTKEWLDQGTDANILKYFGLTWDDTNKRWSYSHGDPGNGICNLPELLTGAVDSKRGSGTITGAPREPDFFELIKATINVGSLGKACFGPQALSKGYQALRDSNVNEQIIQIGANIIDQFDADGYPIRIWYAGATGSGHEFRGVEDLPYIYRIRSHAIQISPPNPNLVGPAPYNSTNNTVFNGSSWVPFLSTGIAAAILLPEVWNPHDGSRGLPEMMPDEFHLTADTSDPNLIYPYDSLSARSLSSSGSSDSTALTTSPYDAAFFSATGSAYKSPLYGSGINQNNDIQFNVNHVGQFREPTALFIPGMPAGSNLRYGSKDRVVTGSPFGAKIPLNADSSAILEDNSGNPSIPSNSYLGICVGLVPVAWITSNNTYVKVNKDGVRTGGVRGIITYSLWYKDPFGTLRTYDQKYTGWIGGGGWAGESGLGNMADISFGTAGSPRLDGKAGAIIVFADPRTRRWGAGMKRDVPGEIYDSFSGPIIPQPVSTPNPIPSPVLMPWRQNELSIGQIWTAATSLGGYYPYDSTGWYPATNAPNEKNRVLFGHLSQNNPSAPMGPNAPAGWSTTRSFFYTDADGVARRAMGAYVPYSATMPATTPIGIPNVPASVVDPSTALCTQGSITYNQSGSNGNIRITVNNGQNLGRPIILNRPFKTVGELAYTFSDTPWRNLDLSTPESGNTALLDVFCIQDDDTPDAIVAGKLNLNTRQRPVLSSLLAGAAKQDDGAFPLSATDVTNIVDALVTRTTGTDAAKGQGPLRNPAELVGRYVGGTPSTGAGSTVLGAVYRGFSEDIAVSAPAPLGTIGSSIQRFRETSIRALSNVGTTRVWNLMIDVIAQTGRYPQSATGLDDFIVEGEKRCWLHVAIDRYTGQVIDQQLEPVSE